MMTYMRLIEQFPFQLLLAALFFGRRLEKRKFFLWKVLLFGSPMIAIYDIGIKNDISIGIAFWDRAILLLPVLNTILVVWLCYDCRILDGLYYTVIAIAAQNLVFNLYWMVITYLNIHEGTFYSVMVSIPIMIFVYSIVYVFFSRKLKEWTEYTVVQSKFISTATIVLLFIIFLNQRITDAQNQYAVYGAYVLGDIFCLLLLFGLFYESGLEQKNLIMEQLLYAEQKKQKMTKENIELINLKCHDLKHQIKALRMMGESEERDRYIKELEQAAIFYESSAKTGNQMLDLLLMEKLLYCEKYQIKVSCIADGEKLSFMKPMDLYSLFGNALDNAIESVIHEEDVNKRIISFRVASHGQILSIHFENYIGHKLEFADGMPVTTKADKKFHGFGMMSIRYIVEKYGGTLQVLAENHLFQMNILLQIPEKSET